MCYSVLKEYLMTNDAITDWREVKLGDVCSSISDTYHGNDEQVILINTSDVLDGMILNHVSVKNEKLKGQFKKTFQKDDILYSEIRPANRRFAFVDIEKTSNYIASTKLMVIRPDKNKILPRFLYTILKSDDLINELQHLAETRSGTFPQITFSSELAPMKVLLPPVEVQRKIAGVLGALDDKIELNNKINQNLELQAQALFKSWFVDFEPFGGSMPDDWKIGKLEDMADVIMGQSPSGNSYNEKGIGCIFFQGRAEFGFRFPTIKLFTTEPRRMARQNDILMSVRAPVGDVNVANEDCCIGRGLCAIRSKDNFQSFILYTLWSVQNKLNIFNGEGTVFGSINKDSLNNLEIIVPNSNTIQKFENLCSPMDNLIRKNYEENTRLSALRDTLLPKLMSGEIDVDNVEISDGKE